MQQHPIHDLLSISLENIKEMVDVNTVIGTEYITEFGQIIIPVSRVKFSFATGGTDMTNHNRSVEGKMAFGGGTGGAVSITPTAFLVLNNNKVDVLTLDNQTHLIEKLIDKVPETIEKIHTKMQIKTDAIE